MWLNVVSALFCDPFTSRFLTTTPDNGGSSVWDLFDLVQLETLKKKKLWQQVEQQSLCYPAQR